MDIRLSLAVNRTSWYDGFGSFAGPATVPKRSDKVLEVQKHIENAIRSRLIPGTGVRFPSRPVGTQLLSAAKLPGGRERIISRIGRNIDTGRFGGGIP